MSALILGYPMEAAWKIVMGIYVVSAVALILLTKGRLGYTVGSVEKIE